MHKPCRLVRQTLGKPPTPLETFSRILNSNLPRQIFYLYSPVFSYSCYHVPAAFCNTFKVKVFSYNPTKGKGYSSKTFETSFVNRRKMKSFYLLFPLSWINGKIYMEISINPHYEEQHHLLFDIFVENVSITYIKT